MWVRLPQTHTQIHTCQGWAKQESVIIGILPPINCVVGECGVPIWSWKHKDKATSGHQFAPSVLTLLPTHSWVLALCHLVSTAVSIAAKMFFMVIIFTDWWLNCQIVFFLLLNNLYTSLSFLLKLEPFEEREVAKFLLHLQHVLAGCFIHSRHSVELLNEWMNIWP